jgi:catechol 2,3-dioxygenase-like lactoylglutathione lyase family enzyme
MRLLEIHIEVSDVEASLEFYRKLLPTVKEVRWTDGKAVALVLPDGTALGLWSRGKEGLYGAKAGQHLHFALQIEPSEYDEYLQRLKSLEVEVIEHDWNDGHRSLYFFDRDGHQGEFMTRDWLGRPSGS